MAAVRVHCVVLVVRKLHNLTCLLLLLMEFVSMSPLLKEIKDG